jgi:glutathione-regulated potassium-efflux system ancillary protein KefC/glutathione-regulated potassium-efflux system protein KefB
MGHDNLTQAFVFLVASVVSVLIAHRVGLGSVLGYLVAGALIGPFGLGFVGDPESVMHAAEFGVVIMLFLIGLELEPALLWRLRGAIVGLGGAQVIVTGLTLAVVGMACGLEWRVAIAAGFILSLSSTAIVMQSLREKGLAATDFGRATFSVLLFQDIAVIPMLALFPLLATTRAADAHAGPLAGLPAWAQTLAVFAAVGVVVLAGRLLTRPLFHWIARSHLNEIFTAAALALVVGVALLMQSVGLSPALGAFVAGVVLADSEYRHELESDIEPFRALLLGLFFISVGAGIDFPLIVERPVLILGLVAGLVVVNAATLYVLARAFGRPRPDAIMIALVLAQGGEFAFVLFAFAQMGGVIPAAVAGPLVAAVALSMALTPLLFVLGSRAASALSDSVTREAPSDLPLTETPHAIIAGFGRFGQIVHRLLRANGYATSILEHSADQVESVRSFGNKANYGDASRVDLLRAAGAADAKLLIVAVDGQSKVNEIVEVAQKHFPHLAVLSRAFDRSHVYELMKRNIAAIERETFEGALRLGTAALRTLGWRAHQAERAAGLFRRHDERNMRAMFEIWGAGDDSAEYRSAVSARRAMVEDMLRRDLATHQVSAPDEAWDTKTLDEEVARRVRQTSQ